MRKAAADTLALLAETLLSAGGSNAPSAAAQPQQGLAALEVLAPDMAAAAEAHLKYDRIPQVRQAAAAALQLLGRVPGMQLSQQPAVPAGPAQPASRPASAAGQASTVPAAAAAAHATHATAPAGGLSQARSNLQAIIAERRRQLQDAGWQPSGAAEVQVYGGRKAAAAAVAARSASSSGSADEAEDGPWSGERIRAWAGGDDEGQRAQQAAEEEEGDARDQPAAARPPSAAAFQSAAEALQWLDGEPAQQAARKRRGWGSRPASPAKQQGGKDAGHGVPVHIYAPQPQPPQQQQQQQLWRENPLAASAEAPGQAGMGPVPTAAPATVQCTHHIEHPQFSLRLQAALPEAQLCLTAPITQQAAAAVHSVRFWAASGGADVGIEFGLAAEPGRWARLLGVLLFPIRLLFCWSKNGLVAKLRCCWLSY